MSYVTFVTRKSWEDDQGEEITLDEWKRVVNSDPDFVLCYGDVYKLKGCDEIRPAIWHDEASGEIWVRGGYFEEVLRKLFEIAAKLGAIVVGEDGWRPTSASDRWTST